MAKDRPLNERERRLAGLPECVDMARSVAATWGRAVPELRDEFESAAMFALVQAAARFREGGQSFPEFAAYRVRGAMRDVCRKVARVRGGEAKRLEMALAWGERLAARCRPVGEDFEQRDAFEQWLNMVPVRYAEVLDLLYWHGYTGAEVARQKGKPLCWPAKVQAGARQYLKEVTSSG